MVSCYLTIYVLLYFLKVASSGKDIDQFLASVTADDILEKVAGLDNSRKILFVMREEIEGTLSMVVIQVFQVFLVSFMLL